ncbi:HHR099Cp [Eremothecium sinecaudum]|uniref:2,5-diamino-6-ribosylamino-4(3H)-pyrimidinone 5'-phosphate reductase n=1 Tax=Eremothecium sinecaudum TaxID=45286 RepID=A0A0X8HWT6_9SACH|nr:HHR099Cp [Eremothecium sinecaudum]AMD22868.1 HHR099Cp [Eremothecium sinecaudum]
MSLVPLPNGVQECLVEYLPRKSKKPFITLTYAQSLDSRISKGPGIRTLISHPETKTVTHYLRYHHDAILIGCNTAITDDPGLNCKWYPTAISGEDLTNYSPRPVIIDPQGRWNFSGSKMESLYLNKQGKPPIVVVCNLPPNPSKDVTYIKMHKNDNDEIDWLQLFEVLKSKYNLHSIMVEGGAIVIKKLLQRPEIVCSLVITIGSTFLGEEGIQVSPAHEVNLTDVNWWHGTTDAVLCARLAGEAKI